MAYLYRHIRLDKNEPFYIGIGTDKKDYKRAYHKHDRNQYWYNIVDKTPYKVEIMLDNLTKEEAIEKEIEFINLYGRKNLHKGTLCNLTNGGEGTINLSPEIRKKINELKHKPILQFNKQGKLIKKWNSGVELRNLYTLKQILSIQTCCRGITNSSLNYLWFYEEKFNTKELNYLLSKPHGKKGIKIKNTNNFRGPKSEQWVKSKSKPVIVFKKGFEKEYSSIQEAMKDLSFISYEPIRRKCKLGGKYKGYTWKYKE
jgi:predicted GIY-YIG superfamily endonuclease